VIQTELISSLIPHDIQERETLNLHHCIRDQNLAFGIYHKEQLKWQSYTNLM